MAKANSSASPAVSRSWEKNAYFISANGYTGFRSHHTDVYASQKFTRVYIIKGGPGTGKSSMMREIAHAAVTLGADCEYIYCSSDPGSLDGILLSYHGRRIAVLDGTAPHTRCTDFPGVIDEIINLGDFWDSERLARERELILSLCRMKTEEYARAYRYLALAGHIDRYRRRLVLSCMDIDKAKKAAERSLRCMRISREPGEEVRYLSAFGMQGYEHLPTLRDSADVITVSDQFGSAALYLNILRDILRREVVYTYRLFPSCFDDDITEGLYLPKNNLLIIDSERGEGERCVNMQRFLNTPQYHLSKQELRFLTRERQTMLDRAAEALGQAGKVHFALEHLYGEAMDFAGKEAYTAHIVAEITEKLLGDPILDKAYPDVV